jgi:hypothetical protein
MICLRKSLNGFGRPKQILKQWKLCMRQSYGIRQLTVLGMKTRKHSSLMAFLNAKMRKNMVSSKEMQE